MIICGSYTKFPSQGHNNSCVILPTCSCGIMGILRLRPPTPFRSCLLIPRQRLCPTLQSLSDYNRLRTDPKCAPGFLPRPLGSCRSAVRFPGGCGPPLPIESRQIRSMFCCLGLGPPKQLPGPLVVVWESPDYLGNIPFEFHQGPESRHWHMKIELAYQFLPGARG